jgi:hypothetical protein
MPVDGSQINVEWELRFGSKGKQSASQPRELFRVEGGLAPAKMSGTAQAGQAGQALGGLSGLWAAVRAVRAWACARLIETVQRLRDHGPCGKQGARGSS